MDIREKLVELMGEVGVACNNTDCSKCDYFDVEGCVDYFIADHMIANGVTVQEWIPVSEPPKECGRYYTNRKLFGGDYVAILQYRIDSDGGYWSYYDDEYGVRLLQDVTHWMPLPTPPKGE